MKWSPRFGYFMLWGVISPEGLGFTLSYFSDYTSGTLTLLEAYALAESKLFKLTHSGIYSGKNYDLLVLDCNKLSRQIARVSLVEHGYMIDDFNGYREWKKVDSFNGFNI